MFSESIKTFLQVIPSEAKNRLFKLGSNLLDPEIFAAMWIITITAFLCILGLILVLGNDIYIVTNNQLKLYNDVNSRLKKFVDKYLITLDSRISVLSSKLKQLKSYHNARERKEKKQKRLEKKLQKNQSENAKQNPTQEPTEEQIVQAITILKALTDKYYANQNEECSGCVEDGNDNYREYLANNGWRNDIWTNDESN